MIPAIFAAASNGRSANIGKHSVSLAARIDSGKCSACADAKSRYQGKSLPSVSKYARENTLCPRSTAISCPRSIPNAPASIRIGK